VAGMIVDAPYSIPLCFIVPLRRSKTSTR
jgi:hypothetical protein